MDKISFHKQIVRKVVEKIAKLSPEKEGGIENQLITDDEHGHYLYFGVGWAEENSGWIYASFIHVDVKADGKVWLQHYGTDMRIAEQLQKHGIPKSDIVIGFQAPAVRKYLEGYAIS
ncbi:MAG: XisI protein [Runella zeae]